jgi:cardiolipin synthase A/B
MKTLIPLLAICTALCGCAGSPSNTDPVTNEIVVSNDAPDKGYRIVRKVSRAGQTGLLYARSTEVEQILRPVSYTTSLASYLFKSTGGTLDRVALSSTLMPALDGEIPAVGNREPMDLVAWEKQLDEITDTRQTRGTIEFLVDGQEYFERLEASILAADESIDIRTYIFDNDDYAVSLADLLKGRSNDDVKVRVMFDSFGTIQATQVDPESTPNNHRAPLSVPMYLRSGSRAKVRTTANPWLTGDHTKTTIIDRRIAYVGGMNIGREYRYEWHDLMMEVRGPVVDSLQYESDKAWARAGLFGDLGNFFAFLKGPGKHADDDGYPMRILQTRNFDSDIYKAQIAAIRNAQSYILIENAYFSDDRMLYELARARRRGVDVRVIVPNAGNHGVLNASANVAINQMLEHGIRVYRFPGMSHVKAAIFDGWVCVGSANFDKLSLKINKELNLATSNPTVVAELLEDVFIPDLMVSREVSKPLDITLTARVAEVLVDELL